MTKLYPNIPPIPRKTLFKIKNSDALENRKKHSKRKDIESNESFKNFLEINQHSPDLIYNSSNNIYKNNELPRCVKDFHFFEEANIMYVNSK